MHRFFYPLILLCAAALPMAAHADTLQTFALSGNFIFDHGTAEHFTAGGSVTIDVSAGTVQSLNFSFIAPLLSTEGFARGFTRTEASNGTYELFEEFGTERPGFRNPALAIFLPTDTLLNYAGGPICSRANPCLGGLQSTGIAVFPFSFTDGQLTPVPAVPEPSSLILLGTGCFSVVAAYKRRRQRS